MNKDAVNWVKMMLWGPNALMNDDGPTVTPAMFMCVRTLWDLGGPLSCMLLLFLYEEEVGVVKLKMMIYADDDSKEDDIGVVLLPIMLILMAMLVTCFAIEQYLKSLT